MIILYIMINFDHLFRADGFLFDKAAILEYMITKKLDYKKHLKAWEKDQERLQNEASEVVEARVKNREEKFLKREDGIVSERVKAFKSGEADSKSVSNMVDGKDKALPSFWIPSLTPASGVTSMKKPSSAVLCPMSGKPIKAKDLIPVNFTRAPEEEGDSKRGFVAKERRYVCALSRDVLNNSTPCAVLRPTGDVVTVECVEKLIKKDMLHPLTGETLKESDIILLKMVRFLGVEFRLFHEFFSVSTVTPRKSKFKKLESIKTFMDMNLGVMENGQRSKEAVQLLQDGHDSSSSDVHYHYQLPPPQTSFAGRKKVYRKHRRKSPSGSVSSSGEASARPAKTGSTQRFLCFPKMSKFVNWLLAFAIFIGASALFWVIYGLRLDLLALERRVHDVESGNQKVPNQLHEYHTKLKAVSENQTAIANRILEISDRINNLTTQLGMLRTSVSKLENGLMKSGTEDLLSLPDDVKTMQSTMATFGSQLRDVTSQLGMVRNASTSMVGRVDACANRVTAVEDLVKNVPDRTQVEAMNKSVAFALEDLHMHHGDIQALKNSTANLPILEASVKNLTESVNWVTESFASTSASVSALENRILQCCDQMAQNDTANG
ncbi:unnamed protein product [Notodromas monacha]|uniref:Uncharacterized protein n=1 Tax=Notodromas monacha TaxID=399045 RepID=A0A7R9BLM6_9CRUS|nr:unnamed protein product [Notodromas monacha]CAG0917758.1 unnamed protein product [Notodromas monacha]